MVAKLWTVLSNLAQTVARIRPATQSHPRRTDGSMEMASRLSPPLDNNNNDDDNKAPSRRQPQRQQRRLSANDDDAATLAPTTTAGAIARTHSPRPRGTQRLCDRGRLPTERNIHASSRRDDTRQGVIDATTTSADRRRGRTRRRVFEELHLSFQ